MARGSAIRYFRSRKAFYTQIGGVQYMLAKGPDDRKTGGPVFEAAMKKFRALHDQDVATRRGDQATLRCVCERYLEWISSRRKPKTYEMRRYALSQIVTGLGEDVASSLSAERVETWLAARQAALVREPGGKPLSATTVRILYLSLAAALNRAVKNGWIPSHALGSLECPGERFRTRSALVSPAEHAALLKIAARSVRPLLVCLENSGCRPGELFQATAAAWNDVDGCLEYFPDATRTDYEASHKTGRKIRVRRIFFTGEALDLVRGLVRERPSGLLFTTGTGGAWSVSSLNNYVARYKRKIGAPHITPYAYRHTFVTRFLERGGNIDLLAELLGNSASVIRKHYAHLDQKPGSLRARLQDVMGEEGRAESPTVEPDFPRIVSGDREAS